MKKRNYWKWIRNFLYIYIGLGIFLYCIQDKFLFHPRKLAADYVYHFDIPFWEILLPINDKRKLSIIQFTVPDSVCKGVVLYFHGNKENINHYAPFATNFTKNKYAVWMMDYPGFGKSTGDRTEKSLYDDALQFYKMALNKYNGDSIIIYGKSLGTGIAAELASIRDCKRLILETPYYSIDAIARHYFFMYPITPPLRFEFPTYLFVEFTHAPITLFHGTDDEVVPYSQSKRLAGVKPGIELISIEKGKHNTLNDFPLFHQKLDSLLAL